MFAQGFAPRRVVVTGMGIASPLGLGVENVWRRLTNGESGISAIQAFDVKDLPARIAGQVPVGEKADGRLDLNEWIPVKDQKKMDRFIQLALVAAVEAVEDSGWLPDDEPSRCATGVMIGSGIGGLETIQEAALLVAAGRTRRLSPFFIPSSLVNLASGHVSIRYGFKGPNHSAVTACATGVHAIGDAARLIALGDADVMVAGGAEAAICELGMGGFCAARALSTNFNDTPAIASRPWDEGRDGFVMGEGAGMLVLESAEHAAARGARVYATVAGGGMTSDGHHIAQPEPEGRGAARAIVAALQDADLAPDDVRHVNAHATSTPQGDVAEALAIRSALGAAADQVVVTGTKSMTGHLLGGAGAVESIFAVLALHHRLVPPTANLTDLDDEVELDVARGEPRALPAGPLAALNNSFGFGGHDVAVVFTTA